MYGIYHEYTIDHGFNDDNLERNLILTTEDEEIAMEYVKQWSKERVYNEICAEICCGRLVYEELPRLITKSDISSSPYELVRETANPYGSYGDDWSGNYSDYKED